MFALFAGDSYYPVGGWGDFQGVFDSLEDAVAAYDEGLNDWGHVVDLCTQKEVHYFSQRSLSKRI